MNVESSLPSDADCARGSQDWPHAPPHKLQSAGVYFVTARAFARRHLLVDDEMKDWFQSKLFELTGAFYWKLEAWAVLSNHYHLVVHSPTGNPETLSPMLQKLHSLTTKELNRRDHTPERTRLWQNFRETHLNLQRGYMARLHYVHQNAVHHRLVNVGSDWPWCSAAAVKAAVTPAWLKTIRSFKYDQIAAEDGE
ncbi:MAG: hypothetical protein JWO94_2076 [Verrucomicrobiaceae bacterium]|nr:hypothetical protein [Verrucomicrobiaceae bacterium]